MKAKRLRLNVAEIRPLAEGYGSCFATDRITMKGKRVGFMYRQAPVDDSDSGWRFLAGDESDAYVTDLDNHGIYDVNIIANFDPEIVPFLDAPCCLRSSGGTVRGLSSLSRSRQRSRSAWNARASHPTRNCSGGSAIRCQGTRGIMPPLNCGVRPHGRTIEPWRLRTFPSHCRALGGSSRGLT